MDLNRAMAETWDLEEERQRPNAKKPAIVIHGNPADGFKFTGPFEDTDEAIEWAESHTPEYEQWNTALLEDPDAEEKSPTDVLADAIEGLKRS